MTLLKPIAHASMDRTLFRAQAKRQPLESTLAEFYWSWFRAQPAETDALRDSCFQLRYRVYCIENAFEDPNPDGKECDEYDRHAVHSLLTYLPTGVLAGTVRLVLPLQDDPHNSFALQSVCRDPLLRNPVKFPVETTAEVSRFCISKEFRRRLGDSGEQVVEMSVDEERRILPHLSLGLIESLVRMSVENGITHWCAVMEPTLLRLLTRLGIHFDPIGPLIEYHGRRQPCYIPLEILLPRVKRERPDVWDVITRGGRHWTNFCQAGSKPGTVQEIHRSAQVGSIADMMAS